MNIIIPTTNVNNSFWKNSFQFQGANVLQGQVRPEGDRSFLCVTSCPPGGARVMWNGLSRTHTQPVISSAGSTSFSLMEA